jgi:hypothetical protein
MILLVIERSSGVLGLNYTTNNLIIYQHLNICIIRSIRMIFSAFLKHINILITVWFFKFLLKLIKES